MAVRHRLVYELHGLSKSGPLITVQRWDGPPPKDGGPQHATVIVAVNGKVTQRVPGTVARCEEELDRVRAALAGRTIASDKDARAVLAAAGLPPEDFCRCGELLPVGCWRCAHCGLSIGRSVSGKMSGARRRGDVVVGGPASDGS
jgi:hypothetical protein